MEKGTRACPSERSAATSPRAYSLPYHRARDTWLIERGHTLRELRAQGLLLFRPPYSDPDRSGDRQDDSDEG